MQKEQIFARLKDKRVCGRTTDDQKMQKAPARCRMILQE